MKIQKRSLTIEKVLLTVLILYLLQGYWLKYSIWNSSTLVYFTIFFLLGGFILCGIKYSRSLIWNNKSVIIWIPYFLITIIGYFLSGNIERATYWLVAFIILLIATPAKICDIVPLRIIEIVGIFIGAGILFQILFPNQYNSKVASLFINSKTIIGWGKDGGYAGFTYQLGMTSIILIYMLAAFFCFQILQNTKRGTLGNWFIFLLIIALVFLSGKRTMSIVAIIIPLFILCIEGNHSSRIRKFMMISIVLLLLIFLLISNASLLVNSRIFGRIAKTIISYKSGGDIISSRRPLYNIAYNVFLKNSFLGIGVGKFIEYTGSYTDVHNAYLQILCEQGIVGLVFFVIPLVFNILKSLQCLKQLASDHFRICVLFSIFIQGVFVFYSFTGNPTIDESCFIMYFLAIAIRISAYDLDKCERIEGK